MPQIKAETYADALKKQRAAQPVPLTNAAALAIARAWRSVAMSLDIPWTMGDVYAASAYGWDPVTGVLDDDLLRREMKYPDAAAALLEADLDRLVAQAPQKGAVVINVDDVWDDVPWRQSMIKRMRSENLKAEFKIPLPMCKDGALPRRGADGKWSCDVVTIDDPVTAAAQPVMVAVVIVAAIWYLSRE